MGKENKQSVENSLKEKTINTKTATNEKKEVIHRRFKGTVVSNKMAKTVVVKVDRFKLHSVYGKRYKVTTKFKAHDSKEQFKIGDQVEIVECRPISRDKKWRVIY